MKNFRIGNNLKSEKGAETIEYVIALTVLLIVFVAAGFAFQRAARERGDASMQSTGRVVPSQGTPDPLCAIGQDACK